MRLWVPYVYLITILSLSYELWKLKTVKSCLCIFNYNIAIELRVMETKNSQKLFSVSITHNSKIRELSDGNRVIETELLFVKQTFCYESHYFWVMSYGNRELSYQKTQSKRAHTLSNFTWTWENPINPPFKIDKTQVRQGMMCWDWENL